MRLSDDDVRIIFATKENFSFLEELNDSEIFFIANGIV